MGKATDVVLEGRGLQGSGLGEVWLSGDGACPRGHVWVSHSSQSQACMEYPA
jgi:hypothetical protein